MWNDVLVKNGIVPLLLRLTLAVVFIYHGVTKVTGRYNDWGATWAEHLMLENMEPSPEEVSILEQYDHLRKEQGGEVPAGPEHEAGNLTEAVKHAYGVVVNARRAGRLQNPHPQMQAAAQLAVAWGELIAGAGLFLGLLTRVAALAMFIIQVGAIVLVTGARGFSGIGTVGWEYNFVLLAVCFTLLLAGGGLWALDRFLPWGRRAALTQPAGQPMVNV